MKCTACPLHETAQTVCVPGEGPVRPDLLFVGEAPGALEDAEGRPFVGEAGQLLRTTLDRVLPAGITYRITNTVRCRPPGNRKPTPLEVRQCTGLYLHDEVKRTKPRLIVALGDTAARALAGVTGILKKEGQTFVTPAGPVMLMAHPAYVLRMPEHRSRWEGKLRTIPGILKPVREIAFTLAEDDDTARRALEALQGPAIAFDYETEGLNPPRDKALTVALCDARERLLVLNLRTVSPSVWTAWLGSKVTKVTHSSFEETVSISCFGVGVTNWIWDTQLCAKLLNENGPTDLKTQTLLKTDLGDYARDIRGKIAETSWKDTDLHVMARYNAGDALATRRLYLVQSELLAGSPACGVPVEDALPWHRDLAAEYGAGEGLGEGGGDETPGESAGDADDQDV